MDSIVASRDVLDDHDGVVDQQAHRQGQSEQGQSVDGEPGHIKDRESPHQNHRDGDRRDEQSTPVLQEDEDDDDYEYDRLDQRLHHFVDG